MITPEVSGEAIAVVSGVEGDAIDLDVDLDRWATGLIDQCQIEEAAADRMLWDWRQSTLYQGIVQLALPRTVEAIVHNVVSPNTCLANLAGEEFHVRYAT